MATLALLILPLLLQSIAGLPSSTTALTSRDDDEKPFLKWDMLSYTEKDCKPSPGTKLPHEYPMCPYSNNVLNNYQLDDNSDKKKYFCMKIDTSAQSVSFEWPEPNWQVYFYRNDDCTGGGPLDDYAFDVDHYSLDSNSTQLVKSKDLGNCLNELDPVWKSVWFSPKCSWPPGTSLNPRQFDELCSDRPCKWAN